MSAPMTDAMKTAKQIQSELVQYENRVEFCKSEVARLNAAKEKLEQEIAYKTSEYQLFISSKDAETKRLREDLLSERQKLDADRQDFLQIMRQFEIDKATLAQAKLDLDAEKNKTTGQRAMVDQFIIAVQRAYTVLG